jgi:2-iminoacetate synthase ThiH
MDKRNTIKEAAKAVEKNHINHVFFFAVTLAIQPSNICNFSAK